MADVVKWLTHWIVVPTCMGSIPIIRPIIKNYSYTFVYEFFYVLIFFIIVYIKSIVNNKSIIIVMENGILYISFFIIGLII